MYFIRGGTKQWCPDQSHDGVWTEGVRDPATRSFWPQGHVSFAKATATIHSPQGEAALPDLDIDLGGLA